MANSALQPLSTAQERTRRLRDDLAQAQQALLDTEAQLGEKQGVVNAFRMQCRLKIGGLVDLVLHLRAEKQLYLTRLRLLQQAEELGIPYDEADPFWQAQEQVELDEDEELLLPHLPETPRDDAAAKRIYRQLARRFHPDLSASHVEQAYRTALMAAINNAYAARDVQTLRDLADELDPTELAELAAIETRQERRMRERLMNLKRRRRKALKQLDALLKDSTTILCYKAQALEAAGRTWWDEIRVDLEREIRGREAEVAEIKAQVEQVEAQRL
ncbi:MAG: J domain-containing protein [Chloroflexi bacterium]|nr:J domain-containing protein [Chloroflexota bacterium]MBP8056794.1 J domain-containing protein [Chloroflexota bacterium]